MKTVLALDLGRHMGWALRSRGGVIFSGSHWFKPNRFEGGGMVWLRWAIAHKIGGAR
jgi:hypothetical protein